MRRAGVKATAAQFRPHKQNSKGAVTSWEGSNDKAVGYVSSSHSHMQPVTFQCSYPFDAVATAAADAAFFCTGPDPEHTCLYLLQRGAIQWRVNHPALSESVHALLLPVDAEPDGAQQQ
jgi:hypothetical protein